jgi:hypothetical protein
MIFKPESFYESSLASTITAVQTTIPVTVAPNETAGFLVLEANTSNREIILYTGVTGTTLTGVTRGLAEYGSSVSAGTGKSHNAGTDIANRDVHYYYAQYYDFLTGVSATGANTMMIGDGGTCSASDRTWQVPLSSYTPFWGLSANGRMVVSEDGITSYVISAGGSGIAAGDGIDITAGVASVDVLSTAGLRISSAQLAVNYSGTHLKSTSAAELYFDESVANSWTGLQTFKTSSVFQSSGSHIFDGDVEFGGSVGFSGNIYYYADADEVIAVSSKPKAVKLTSAGRVYMVSSSDVTYTDPYVGFCLTAASAAGSQVKVQVAGVVNGFSGLTPGSIYYAGGQGGEISTTQGTVELKTGVAYAATKLLIEKGYHQYFSSVTPAETGVSATVPTGTNFIMVDGYSLTGDTSMSMKGELNKYLTTATNTWSDSNTQASFNNNITWTVSTSKVWFSLNTDNNDFSLYFFR